MAPIPFMKSPLAVVAVVAIIGVAAFYMISTEGGTEPLDWPAIPGLTSEQVYVRFTAVIGWGGLSVDIFDETIVTQSYNTPLTIGSSGTISGEIVAEVLKDGNVVDSETTNYEINLLYGEEGIAFGPIKMGPPDSGTYEIRVSTFEAETGALLNFDTANRTI